jgi:pimeloyl-ACP methyl ester carboxylesterase
MSERTILFGANSGLVGTLALPDAANELLDVGLLLFNAGVIHRVGPHRINVRIARQLAAHGVPSIRFDLAGHGDSARPSGNHSFEEQAVIDIRSAMDALGAAAKVRRFAIFGFCSGAYYGYSAARADERVAGLLMFDAYRYPTPKTRVLHYWNRLHQPRALSAVLQLGKRVILRVARREVDANRRMPSPAPELGRIDFIPSKQDFAKGLHTLLSRGARIHMIYSGGALREYNYSGQFADTFASCGFGQRIQADFLPQLDHVVTGLADQADLTRRVTEWSLTLRPTG